jgi:hypothetical protein
MEPSHNATLNYGLHVYSQNRGSGRGEASEDVDSLIHGTRYMFCGTRNPHDIHENVCQQTTVIDSLISNAWGSRTYPA